MKKIYYVLIAFAALLTFAPAISAQTPQKPADPSINGQIKDPKTGAALVFPKADVLHTDEENQFAYSKNISQPFNDGTYWIKLESFSTGNATVKLEDAPADIVLVLDVSGSMSSRYSRNETYVPTISDRRANYSIWNNPAGSYDYNNATDETLYVKYNGNYYEVERRRDGNNRQYYNLYFTIPGSTTRYYLDGTQITTTMPTTYTNQYGPCWTGVLYSKETDVTRLEALKAAVGVFIEEIQNNDLYATDEETGQKIRRTDEYGNPTRLGNRVSIVKYAGNSYANADHLVEGNDTYGYQDYNYSQLVKNYRYVDDSGELELMKAIAGIKSGGATAADYGMTIANEVLAQAPPTDRPAKSSKTVVLFTDGEPNHHSGFDDNVANATIAQGNTAKTTNEAKVFTVGVFTNETNDIKTYMGRTSSNYKDATSMTNSEATEVSTSYYKNAPNGDLSAVFALIAKQSGGSQSALSTATSTVDVVSNSFKLPDNVDADNIGQYVKVFTAKLTNIKSDGTYEWATEVLAPWSDDTYNIYDEAGQVIETPDVDDAIEISLKEGTDNTVKVLNFDYSNNWCGPIVDETTHTTTYQGHKIIIMIPIKMNPDAVGGPNVDTNGSGSGIFVNDTDTEPTIDFISPTVSLPVNIHLTKTGLRMGESAKFKIERATIHEDDELDEDGVPVSATWNYVSTVFVTKNSAADPLVKVRGLPSTHLEGTGSSAVQVGYIYRITEEEWSWSYQRDVTPQYTVTSKVDNPFTFENTKIPGIEQKVRHAESKATNIFKPGETVHVKYDDSKKNTGTGRPNN